MAQKILTLILLAFIVLINVLHFTQLEAVPKGVQIDEQTAGVTLACMAQDGSSPLGETHYPLFGYNSFATPTPPTYMYPGILWVKAFGFSIESLRAFSVLAFTIALFGLFAIGRTLGGFTCGLWVMLAASISPWTWTFTRLSWESTFMLPFFTWGLFASLTGKKHWHFILSGALFSLAAYSYPPARLQMPLTLMLLTLYGILSLRWKVSHIMTLGLSFLATSLPLIIIYVTSPSLSARFNELAITNPAYLQHIGKTGSIFDILNIIAQNFLTFLTPDFLFFKGTPLNLTLTTGHQGVMSWLDIVAVLSIIPLFWITPKTKNALTAKILLAGFLILGIIANIFPATLISIDNPHTLRASAAWPFAMIATGLIIHAITRRWAAARWPAVIISMVFAFVFLTQYFKQYPKDSIGMFSAWTLEEAKKAKTENEWMNFLYHYHPHMFTSRYYLMRYHGDSCSEARAKWEKLYPMFKSYADQQRKANP